MEFRDSEGKTLEEGLYTHYISEDLPGESSIKSYYFTGNYDEDMARFFINLQGRDNEVFYNEYFCKGLKKLDEVKALENMRKLESELGWIRKKLSLD